mgnify:CR=1 FL=1
MYVFERYEDIKAQVIEVLCRKLEKMKDERKRRIITKHLRRLAPTKGAAAVDLIMDFDENLGLRCHSRKIIINTHRHYVSW